VDRSQFAVNNARAGVRPTAARLAVALLAPLAVAALRLFGPPQPIPGDAAWLAAGAAALAATALGLGTLTLLVRGLRAGEAALLAGAAGAGALAVGLAVMAIRAPGSPATFPDAGLAVAGLIGAAFLLGAHLLPDAPLRGRGTRVAGAVIVFVVIEAALAGAIFLQLPTQVGLGLYVGAALLLTAAALLARSTAEGLLAGGLAALAIARPGALDAVAPLAAFATSGLLMAWIGAAQRTSTHPALPSAAPDAADADDPGEQPPLLPWPLKRAGSAATPDEEAARLARELRGTIEELLETRRTIELQRAEIARAASTDPLTGVASRRAILERLRVEAAEARRYTHPLAVLLLDVDGFSGINHDHGLEVGDAVLRELALRLRLRMRAADALGRAGGDSFLAILPHTDERGATVFAEALMRRLSTRPVGSAAGEITVRVSIGVAFVRPGTTMSDEELLVAVDEALASAKAGGGNRIAFDRLHGLARLDERREKEPGAADGGDLKAGS
jgi:diguanylate cyclase (GGDEF)-like protein